jgi:hypothetical protein
MKRTQLASTLTLIVLSGFISSCYSGDGYTMHFKGVAAIGNGHYPVEVGLNRNGQAISGRYIVTEGSGNRTRYFESRIAYDAINKYYTGGGTHSTSKGQGQGDGHLTTLDIMQQFDTLTIADCMNVDNLCMPYRNVIMVVVK